MDNNIIVHNLHTITTSRLCSISRLYQFDKVNTSNVYRLQKALKQIVDSVNRIEVKVTVEVTDEEVKEMLDFLEKGIEVYKIKYNRTTVDRNMNIYQLIENLEKLNPAQIIKEVLSGANDKPKMKLSKKEREEHEYQNFLISQRVQTLSK